MGGTLTLENRQPNGLAATLSIPAQEEHSDFPERSPVALAATLSPDMARAGQAPALSDVLFDPALPVLGNPQGDVTIAEFLDCACPSCKVLHPHLKRIVEEDGGIRLVMKDWPINGDLVSYASRMVLAADRLGHYASAHSADHGDDRGHGARTHRRRQMRDRGIDVAEVRDALDLHLGGGRRAAGAQQKTGARAFAARDARLRRRVAT